MELIDVSARRLKNARIDAERVVRMLKTDLGDLVGFNPFTRTLQPMRMLLA